MMHLFLFLTILVVVTAYVTFLYKFWDGRTIDGMDLEGIYTWSAVLFSFILSIILIVVMVGVWQLTQ